MKLGINMYTEKDIGVCSLQHDGLLAAGMRRHLMKCVRFFQGLDLLGNYHRERKLMVVSRS